MDLEKKYPKYEENDSAFSMFSGSKKLRELLQKSSQVASKGVNKASIDGKMMLQQADVEMVVSDRRWVVARASNFGRT